MKETRKKLPIIDMRGKFHWENPRNQLWTENPIHKQGSGLRWDSNRGPQRLQAGKETNANLILLIIIRCDVPNALMIYVLRPFK